MSRVLRRNSLIKGSFEKAEVKKIRKKIKGIVASLTASQNGLSENRPMTPVNRTLVRPIREMMFSFLLMCSSMAA